ncbi:MAG: rRNA pseudouridine synthase [Candidatus Omnitrophota bacterium]|nr:MAG: rRNA pseudouridine synthase [Candidatus Omnitrophota bacterium]
MRLNLFISKSGFSSRRKADSFIKEGKVEVNGQVVREPFFEVAKQDEIKVEGKAITLKSYVYIVFNKPHGVTATVSDRFAIKKVVDFVPKKFKGVYPVGRLDKDSSGLLILTNDGDFCYKLTHPKFSVEKEYLVKVAGIFGVAQCRRAKIGIRDDKDLLWVKDIKILRKIGSESLLRIVITEGKKRHLRRLFAKLGFRVLTLKRVRIGKLTLGNLKEGQFRLMDKAKIYALCIKK